MGLIRMGPPGDLMIKLLSEFSIENFIETGTYQGTTASWAAAHFPHVLTIEFSQYFYDECRRKFKHLSNVEFIFGDSRDELKKLEGRFKSPSIFWLDAHWSGGETYGDSDQCPVIDEIRFILASRQEDFIFIDDARLFLSPPQPPHRPEQWPDITTILDCFRGAESPRYIVIIEDVIIAVPSFARALVVQHCQDVNTKLWEEYGREQNKSNFKKGLKLIYAGLPATPKKMISAFGNVYRSAKKAALVKDKSN